jgi:hypothetical protein
MPPAVPCGDRPDRVGDEPEEGEEHAQEGDLHRRVLRVGIDELREEREEEQRGLGIEHVHDDPLREGAAEVPLTAERDLRLGMLREERPQAERDEVHRARDLHRGECDRRGQHERREAKSCGGDVHERADVDAEDRDDAGAASVLDGSRYHIEHGRPGDEQQREGGKDEDSDRGRVGDHAFSSQTSRSPASVR